MWYRVELENPVMVPWDEDPESGRKFGVPIKEIPESFRLESFAGISGTNEDVRLLRNAEATVHPVGIGKCKDPVVFVVNQHG